MLDNRLRIHVDYLCQETLNFVLDERTHFFLSEIIHKLLNGDSQKRLDFLVDLIFYFPMHGSLFKIIHICLGFQLFFELCDPSHQFGVDVLQNL